MVGVHPARRCAGRGKQRLGGAAHPGGAPRSGPHRRRCGGRRDGGITNTRAFASRFGPHGLGIPLAGLYDARTRPSSGVGWPQRVSALHSIVTDRLAWASTSARRIWRTCSSEHSAFEAVEAVIEAAGEAHSLRLLAGMPAQRDWTREALLRRFLGVRSGRKARYAALLVEALEPGRVPEPLRPCSPGSEEDRGRIASACLAGGGACRRSSRWAGLSRRESDSRGRCATLRCSTRATAACGVQQTCPGGVMTNEPFDRKSWERAAGSSPAREPGEGGESPANAVLLEEVGGHAARLRPRRRMRARLRGDLARRLRVAGHGGRLLRHRARLRQVDG